MTTSNILTKVKGTKNVTKVKIMQFFDSAQYLSGKKCTLGNDHDIDYSQVLSYNQDVAKSNVSKSKKEHSVNTATIMPGGGFIEVKCFGSKGLRRRGSSHNTTPPNFSFTNSSLFLLSLAPYYIQM